VLLLRRTMSKDIKIMNVAGARPNFVKIAPIMREMRKDKCIIPILVHTGQHYDEKMSKLFFDDLEIPRPDVNLEVGSGSHAEQTAKIMKHFEPILLKERPDYVLVVGDVNSTIACALTASKLGIKIIHVEAGLRSFDRSMPEEINRVLTDALSDILFITEKSAEGNLLREGVRKDKIFFVGNVMIDTLLRHKEKARNSRILFDLGLLNGSSQCNSQPLAYAVLTLHRPNNVDSKIVLSEIMEALTVVSQELPIIFPIHPRTRRKMTGFKLMHYFSTNKQRSQRCQGILLTEPLGYLDFLHLMANSRLVLTDSGGMQEETTVLGIPCVTLRENTERPVTVTGGTNRIAGIKKEKILEESLRALRNGRETCRIPELWDGKTAERIVRIIQKEFKSEEGRKMSIDRV
jgi:UDP-N-acetylglucosamine 2-epimerase (non-hydrolysing)